MDLSVSAYQALVYVHLLLFVLWLGADVGVYVCGQHFRKRGQYTLDQRLPMLKLLVIIDMVPRTAWALMVPLSLSVVASGGYWDVPAWIFWPAWIVGLFWLFLVWDSHNHDMTPRAARNRRIEGYLRWLIGIFYLGLGSLSLATGEPLAADWLAWKAFLFGLIFVAAIMIDVTFKPVGRLLMAVIEKGSSDETELPLLHTMNRTRIWVWMVYILLVVTAFMGNVKPVF